LQFHIVTGILHQVPHSMATQKELHYTVIICIEVRTLWP